MIEVSWETQALLGAVGRDILEDQAIQDSQGALESRAPQDHQETLDTMVYLAQRVSGSAGPGRQVLMP